MAKLTTRQLLRLHVSPFAVAFTAFTTVLLTNYAVRRLPQLNARGEAAGTIVEALLLAVPFVVAMTIPMAVFFAVLWVFTRLGAAGDLAAARQEPGGIRRLIAPVLAAAAGIAVLTTVWNAEILPRANHRLSAVLAGVESVESVRGDREMTIGQLRSAAQAARTTTGPTAQRLVVRYEVELQKKFALAASIVVLALTGAALGLLFGRPGVLLVIGASFAVFAAYYFALVTGETLVNRLAVSPFIGMWSANAIFATASLLVLWWRGRPNTPRRAEALALG